MQDAVEDRSEESVRGDRPGGAEGGRPAPVWQRTRVPFTHYSDGFLDKF